MADISALLKDWGFETLEDKFAENEIDREALLQLNESTVKELIPKIGPRIKFLTKLKNFQASQALDNMPIVIQEVQEDFSSEPASTDSERSDEKLVPQYVYSQKAILGQPYVIATGTGSRNSSTVKQLLDTSEEGAMIKASYGAKKQFLRNKLSSLLIKAELQNNQEKRITTTRFIELAKEINDLFPHEAPEIYYVPYVNENGKPKAARGKLWSTYIHMRSNLKQLGLMSPKNNSEEKNDVDEDINDPDTEEKILWLKNNSHPFAQVQEYWKETSIEVRKHFLTTIESYMNAFPILRDPLGYTLLEEDFLSLYPEKENKFYSCWPHFAKIILKYIILKKHCYATQELEKYEKLQNKKIDVDNLSERDLVFVLIDCLPLLFHSPALKSKQNKRWKPSKIEIKQGFVLQAADAADMEVKLELRNEKYQQHGLTAQPLPIIIITQNNIEACYVNINQIYYKVDTVCKAVDLTFKISQVLDAKYSPEAKLVWLFIQQAIYEIFTPHDEKFTSVTAIISDLKNLM